MKLPLSAINPQLLSDVDLEFDTSPILLVHIPAILAIFVLAKVIYLRHFHPLAGFPGPFLGSITNFYQMYVIWTGRAERFEAEWHKKYGPIVRVRPNVLSSSDPRHMPFIYHKDADKTKFQDLPAFGIEQALASQRSHKIHAQLKKRIAPAFQLSVVKKSEGLMDTQIVKLLKQLDRLYLSGTVDGKKDGVLDIAPWTRYLAYDVITELAFDDNQGFLMANEDVGGLIGELLKALRAAMIVSAVADLFLQIYNEPFGIGKWLLNSKPDPNAGLGKIISFAQNQIDKRRKRIQQGKPVREDVVNHIMNLKDSDGNPVKDSYILAELTVITFAGSDTTSAALRTTIHNVLKDPTIKAKLTAEIDSRYESGALSGKIATYDALNKEENCPYLYAVLDEARRYRAPAPVILPRKVDERGLHLPVGHGKQEQTVFIPPGVDIGCNSMITSRDTKFYGPDADTFKPERWLAAKVGKERVAELKRADLSFGAGARACLGKNIAWMEMAKVIAALFRFYDMNLVETPPGEKGHEALNYSMWHEDGIWISIRRRDVPEWTELDALAI